MRRNWFVIVAALLLACNPAKEYGEATMPGAECTSIDRDGCRSSSSSAVCRLGREVYRCTAGGRPECELIRTMPAEQP